MSDAVAAAAIAAGGLVVSSAFTAVLAVVVAKINRRVKVIHGDQVVIRDQLDNDHVFNPAKVSNLREDLDGKHFEVIGHQDKKFNAVADVVRGEFADFRREVSADIGGIRSDLRITRREVAATNERIDSTNKIVNRLCVRLEPRKELA